MKKGFTVIELLILIAIILIIAAFVFRALDTEAKIINRSYVKSSQTYRVVTGHNVVVSQGSLVGATISSGSASLVATSTTVIGAHAIHLSR